MERAVLLAKGEIIEISAFPFANSLATAASVASSPAMAVTRHVENLATPIPQFVENNGATALAEVADPQSLEQIGRDIVKQIPDPSTSVPSEDVFRLIEVAVVKAALDRTKGNKQAAAALLGLYRPRLYSMIKRHNLDD